MKNDTRTLTGTSSQVQAFDRDDYPQGGNTREVAELCLRSQLTEFDQFFPELTTNSLAFGDGPPSARRIRARLTAKVSDTGWLNVDTKSDLIELGVLQFLEVRKSANGWELDSQLRVNKTRERFRAAANVIHHFRDLDSVYVIEEASLFETHCVLDVRDLLLNMAASSRRPSERIAILTHATAALDTMARLTVGDCLYEKIEGFTAYQGPEYGFTIHVEDSR